MREASPWDAAHAAVDLSHKQRSDGPRLEYAEPDYEHAMRDVVEFRPPTPRPTSCAPNDSKGYPWSVGSPPFGWHLADAFTQLTSARKHIESLIGEAVSGRAAVLDTGYDPDHITQPKNFLTNLGHDYRDNDRDPIDPGIGGLLNQPGHGTATMAILASGDISVNQGSDPRYQFTGIYGAAPMLEVVPVRIANSVIHFRSSTMAFGIEHAVATGCDVVSISMGGIPSKAWADEVNRAYDAGVFIAAAAGNSYGGFPIRHIVWPARYERVTAVCGATADKEPYTHGSFVMQGNYGPASAMRTAMAAYTPNIPWARMGCSHTVDLDGGGTSSATPQVAGAAALVLAAMRAKGIEPPATGARVEAIRQALFSTADDTHPKSGTYFGHGLLRAMDAVQAVASDTGDDSQYAARPDDVSFAYLRSLDSWQRLHEESPGRAQMLEVEAAQLATQLEESDEFWAGCDGELDATDQSLQQRAIAFLKTNPGKSQALQRVLSEG